MGLRKDKAPRGRQLEDLRKLLSSQREAMATELRQSTAEFLNEETAYTDSVDMASAETDRNLAAQMNNRERETLFQMDEALRRLDMGTFGNCEQCEEEISAARLKVYPFTTLCVDCKAELESEKRRA
jgi:DnaK suppressor protein